MSLKHGPCTGHNGCPRSVDDLETDEFIEYLKELSEEHHLDEMIGDSYMGTEEERAEASTGNNPIDIGDGILTILTICKMLMLSKDMLAKSIAREPYIRKGETRTLE